MSGRVKRKVEFVRIPILGKIKCGQKSDKGFPQSLDYFIADGKYKAYFDKAFGSKPKDIEVIFLSDNVEEVCNERLELRQGTKLFAWGDGETFHVWSKEIKDYKIVTVEDHPKVMDMAEQKASVGQKERATWKTILTLRFLIPRIGGVFGVWQLTTKGENSSIPQIVSVFDKVKSIAGTVTNIPFDLSVDKVKSQKPDDKNLFPVIRLIPNISQESLGKIMELKEIEAPIRGMLTDEKIESLKSLPHIPDNIKNEIEADYTMEVENLKEG
jgi:hypothetical protein